METSKHRLKVLEREEERLTNLRSYSLLDSPIEEDLEEPNHHAATICETPVSLIVLSDKERQWFKSHYGWNEDAPYVNINLKKDHQQTIITVEDNGEGIDEKISDRIYDIFFRGNTKSNGFGLGLFITKKAVEKLDGAIACTSTPFESTIFTIHL